MRRIRLIVSILLSLTCAYSIHAQEDPNCPGAPVARLTIGEQARVLPGDPNNVRDIPSRSGTLVGAIPGSEFFNVLDGPTCADGFNWWQIEYAGLTGWTVEGLGADYWIEPMEAAEVETSLEPAVSPTNTLAPESVSSFDFPINAVNTIEVGAQVRVVNDDPFAEMTTLTLTVRAAPGRDGAPLAQATEGDLLEVIGGPEIADGLRWWQVETARGTQGWVIEGLTNPERNNFYERTLLATCPAEGERVIYFVSRYIFTSDLHGEDPCVLDYVEDAAWLPFSTRIFSFDSHFAVSPDRQFALYVHQLHPVDERAFPTTYRVRLDGSENLLLKSNIAVDWAAWSPDSQQIAILSDRQVGVMNADGSDYIGLTDGTNDPQWVSWLPSGNVIFAQSEEGAMVFYEIDNRGGNRRELFRVSDLSIYLTPPNISPDGTMLAYYGYVPRSNSEFKTIIVDLESGQLIAESELAGTRSLWLPDSSAMVSLVSDMGLYVLPINGEEGHRVQMTGDFPFISWWDFVGWDSPSTFLFSAGTSENESERAGIWSVNTETGAVERIP